MSGPPESPLHVSLVPSPAQSIVETSNASNAAYAFSQALSELIGTPAWRSCVVADPLSVCPQPMIVATTPGDHSAASLPVTRRIGSKRSVAGVGEARCSRARS